MADDLPPVSLADQLACCEREVKMRERVYPGWVERGRMTPQKAAAELHAMRSVVATLRQLHEGSRLL